MNLIEALKTGKVINRKGKPAFHVYPDTSFTTEEILAEDWEAQPIKKEITREDLKRAWNRTMARYKFNTAEESSVFLNLILELGL